MRSMVLTVDDRKALIGIRAGFVLQGTTFRAWCIHNGIDPGYAHRVAAGLNNGPAAVELRSRITAASKVEPSRG